MLTIFQILTLEHWIDPLMYQFMSANNTYLTALYFLGLVIIGYFFMMNLFLAQMIESFNEQTEEAEEEAISSLEALVTPDGSPDAHAETKLAHMKGDSAHLGQNVMLKGLPENVDICTLDESALIDETQDEHKAR